MFNELQCLHKKPNRLNVCTESKPYIYWKCQCWWNTKRYQLPSDKTLGWFLMYDNEQRRLNIVSRWFQDDRCKYLPHCCKWRVHDHNPCPSKRRQFLDHCVALHCFDEQPFTNSMADLLRLEQHSVLRVLSNRHQHYPVRRQFLLLHRALNAESFDKYLT